jgi:hypothetical protein
MEIYQNKRTKYAVEWDSTAAVIRALLNSAEQLNNNGNPGAVFNLQELLSVSLKADANGHCWDLQ